MAKFIGTYEIPTYAISAIEYWDFSGLNDDDERNIKEFISANFPNGFICDWKGIDDPHFTHYPIFGKGCDVVECDFNLPN